MWTSQVHGHHDKMAVLIVLQFICNERQRTSIFITLSVIYLLSQKLSSIRNVVLTNLQHFFLSVILAFTDTPSRYL